MRSVETFVLYFIFTPRALYVPNVAKRSIMTSVYRPTSRPTDDRPTNLIWKISNDRISATGHRIHFTFGSLVGFSESADRMALFPVGPNTIGI